MVAFNEYMQPANTIILPKNTQIPASGSEVFSTVSNRQQVYECEVTEGEETDLQYVRIVGQADIRLPGTYPAGAPMQVSMSYDADGIVHVHVHDMVATVRSANCGSTGSPTSPRTRFARPSSAARSWRWSDGIRLEDRRQRRDCPRAGHGQRTRSHGT